MRKTTDGLSPGIEAVMCSARRSWSNDIRRRNTGEVAGDEVVGVNAVESGTGRLLRARIGNASGGGRQNAIHARPVALLLYSVLRTLFWKMQRRCTRVLQQVFVCVE